MLSIFSCADWLLLCFMKHPDFFARFWVEHLIYVAREVSVAAHRIFHLPCGVVLLRCWCSGSDACSWVFPPILGLCVLGSSLTPTYARPGSVPRMSGQRGWASTSVLWVSSPCPSAPRSEPGPHRCCRGWPLRHPKPEAGIFSRALETSLGIKESLYFVISVSNALNSICSS